MASRVSGLGPVIPKTEFPDTGLPLAPNPGDIACSHVEVYYHML